MHACISERAISLVRAAWQSHHGEAMVDPRQHEDAAAAVPPAGFGGRWGLRASCEPISGSPNRFSSLSRSLPLPPLLRHSLATHQLALRHSQQPLHSVHPTHSPFTDCSDPSPFRQPPHTPHCQVSSTVTDAAMAFVSGVLPLPASAVGRHALCGTRRVAAPAAAVGRTGVRMTSTDTPAATKAATEAADEVAAAAARHAEAEKHAAGVTFDNEQGDASTRLTVTGNDRPGLLDDLTAALNSCGVTVLRATVSTRDDGMVNDVFTVVRGDKKLRSEDLNTVRRQVMAVLNQEPSSSSQSRARAKSLRTTPPASARGDKTGADPRTSPASVYVDHNRGVSVLADNVASPEYTTFTINAPDAPNLVSRVLQNFGYLDLNVRFAAMSSYNDEGVYRHDVYHLTRRDGKQVEEGVKEELRNNIFFMITSPGLDDVRLLFHWSVAGLLRGVVLDASVAWTLARERPGYLRALSGCFSMYDDGSAHMFRPRSFFLFV